LIIILGFVPPPECTQVDGDGHPPRFAGGERQPDEAAKLQSRTIRPGVSHVELNYFIA
jgi:hypothetical protein